MKFWKFRIIKGQRPLVSSSPRELFAIDLDLCRLWFHAVQGDAERDARRMGRPPLTHDEQIVKAHEAYEAFVMSISDRRDHRDRRCSVRREA